MMRCNIHEEKNTFLPMYYKCDCTIQVSSVIASFTDDVMVAYDDDSISNHSETIKML